MSCGRTFCASKPLTLVWGNSMNLEGKWVLIKGNVPDLLCDPQPVFVRKVTNNRAVYVTRDPATQELKDLRKWCYTHKVIAVMANEVAAIAAAQAVYAKWQLIQEAVKENRTAQMEIIKAYADLTPQKSEDPTHGWVLHHPDKGVFLGEVIGLAFWSELDNIRMKSAVWWPDKKSATDGLHALFKGVPEEIPHINPVKVPLLMFEGEMAATRESCMEAIEGLEWDISTLNWAGQDDGGG